MLVVRTYLRPMAEFASESLPSYDKYFAIYWYCGITSLEVGQLDLSVYSLKTMHCKYMYFSNGKLFYSTSCHLSCPQGTLFNRSCILRGYESHCCFHIILCFFPENDYWLELLYLYSENNYFTVCPKFNILVTFLNVQFSLLHCILGSSECWLPYVEGCENICCIV